jgi:hypothetical protein
MAKPGTTRRRVLRAAASIPFLPLAPARAEPVEAPTLADREAWDQNLARYRHLAARAKKAEETGWFRAANERWYRESADPVADHAAAFTRMRRAEDLFWHRCTAPMQEAAIALVLVQVPDLEAIGEKLTVIRAHELYEPGSMDQDCLEVLERDVDFLQSSEIWAVNRMV